MHIVYAAEKPSIATVLSEHVRTRVSVQDIEVKVDPNETGRFLINWGVKKYVMHPNGEVASAVENDSKKTQEKFKVSTPIVCVF